MLNQHLALAIAPLAIACLSVVMSILAYTAARRAERAITGSGKRRAVYLGLDGEGCNCVNCRRP
jgi:hypothetical protein